LHGELIQQAFELVKSCSCTDGCPSCVGPGGTGLAFGQTDSPYGGKRETVALLDTLTT
jgi:hypothetical protein